MIEIFTGTPGSGKSYHAVQSIIRALRRGKTVYSNIWLNLDNNEFRGKYNYIIDIDIKKLLPVFEQGNLLFVVDECQVYLGSRTWASSPDRDIWLRYMQLHRHVDNDVILVTQQFEMIDKQVRSLCEYETIHINIRRVKWLRWICILFRIDLMLAKCVNVPSQIKLSTDWVIGRKKYYKYYDTKQIVQSGNFVSWCLGASHGKEKWKKTR